MSDNIIYNQLYILVHFIYNIAHVNFISSNLIN